MTPSEVEKAVVRGILKGGLLLLLVILVIWLLLPLLFPLLLVWGLDFFDRFTAKPLREHLIAIGFILIIIGIPLFMAYKRIWIYGDRSEEGIRLYIAVGKGILFHVFLVVLAIALGIYLSR